MRYSLEVYLGDRLVFHSHGKWLYPLFELEQFIVKSGHDPKQFFVKDKIIGKAAAMILIHLGVRHIEAGIMSEVAQAALESHHIDFSYAHLVDKIQCRTESILLNEMDPGKAYDTIRNIAEKAKKK
jgi:zinc transport system ATP-binding protein